MSKTKTFIFTQTERTEDLTYFRRAFQDVQYVCGSRIQDVDGKIKAYARENLNCQSLIEIQYCRPQPTTSHPSANIGRHLLTL